MEKGEVTHYGIWYTPDQPERKLSGRVRVAGHYINLDISDPVCSNFTGNIEEAFPVILGVGQYGESITLLDCRGFSGTYESKIMLYGDRLFSTDESLMFSSISVMIPYFDRWIGCGNFNLTPIQSGFTIAYNKRPPIKVEIDDVVIVKIEFKCHAPSNRRREKVTLHEYAEIRMLATNNSPLNLKEWMKYVIYLQQLTSFLVRDGANIDLVQVYSSADDYDIDPRLKGANVYAPGIYHTPYEHINSGHELLKYQMVSANFSEFLKRWFKFAKDGQHIINLILQDYYFQGPFDENRFMNLSRVVEIFHAYKRPATKKREKKEFQKWKKEILSAVPKIHLKELTAILGNSNYLTLDMRITDLMDDLQRVIPDCVNVFDEIFKKEVKDSRNFYTHFGKDKPKGVKEKKELMELTNKCRTFINFSILLYLEVPNDVLEQRYAEYNENIYYSNYMSI